MKLRDFIKELQDKLDVYEEQGNMNPTIKLHGSEYFYTAWNFDGVTILPLQRKEGE